MSTTSDEVRLVDTGAAAVAVKRAPSTVRWWAHTGKLERKGTDKQGRALYDLGDVYKIAGGKR